ncbi:DUF4282 domain-containing protein [Herbaspirillum chlorophenolicum]|uniref:DUF4282 domain-containing protein n=1 Tax=Herbaspirillum chlorophenolicum TaxID=211589 RepID=UPI000B02C6B4|nr:DUF4282 domain-containing protein [Herbaspirillum chlorophenolicum]
MKKTGFLNGVRSHVNFEHLVTPLLIRLTYGVGLVIIISAGIGSLFTAFTLPENGVMRAALSIGATLLVLVLWRLINELWILAFNLHTRLVEIRELLAQRQSEFKARQKTSGISAQ